MDKTRKAFVILILVVTTGFFVAYLLLSNQPQSIPSPKPSPSPTAAPMTTPAATPTLKPTPTHTATPTLIQTVTPTATQITGNVTVSGTVTIHGLTIPPTEVAFTSGETQEVYKAPINQTNQSYTISLPINQTYGIEGDWNGRTFNATGIPMGAMQMQLYGGGYVLNLLDVASTSITQNLQVGMQP